MKTPLAVRSLFHFTDTLQLAVLKLANRV